MAVGDVEEIVWFREKPLDHAGKRYGMVHGNHIVVHDVRDA